MSASDAERATAERLALARLVKRSDPNDLRKIIEGDGRAATLDWIFEDMPRVFRPDRAGATQAVIHWRIGNRSDGGTDTYEIVIGGGRCETSVQPRREPRLALTISGVDFLRMVTGNANPMTLFLRGRMKASGDIGLATRFAKMFDLPKV